MKVDPNDIESLSLSPYPSSEFEISFLSFVDFATKNSILEAYELCKSKPTIGKDGMSERNFSDNLEIEIEIIHNRIQNEKYNFTSYLERLTPKSFDVLPRRIAIPTFRDKITLKMLQNYLKYVFFEFSYMKHQLAIIDELKIEVEKYQYFARFDIKGYYDSIPHSILLSILDERIPDEYSIKIIKRAVNNGITAMNQGKQKKFREIGIPQGLSISNILANIYAGAIDYYMDRNGYHRYVDDIIILSSNQKDLDEKMINLKDIIEKLDLKFNDKKFKMGPIESGFDYLGYSFNGKDWIIRDDTLNGQFRAIHSIVTKFKYDLEKSRLDKRKNSKRILYARFVDDLNVKIAGAMYRGKKYGFTFYFSKITNIKQLHQLDAFVQEQLEKFAGLQSKEHKVKSHVRAYFAWRADNPENYITQYGHQMTTEEKFQYLENRDLVKGVLRRYSAWEINRLYESYIKRKLRYIDKFTGNLS